MVVYTTLKPMSSKPLSPAVHDTGCQAVLRQQCVFPDMLEAT